MPLTARIAFAALAAALVLAPAAQADTTYLKITGINGSVTDAGYETSSKVEGYDIGVKNTTTFGGGGASTGKAAFDDLLVTKKLDRASPFLLTSVATGKTYPTATLTVVKSGATPFVWLKYCFRNVAVNRDQVSGDQEGALETVGLAYGRIVETFTEQDPKTGAPKSWVGGFDLVNAVSTTTC